MRVYLHCDIQRSTLGYLMYIIVLHDSIQGEDVIEHTNDEFHELTI